MFRIFGRNGAIFPAIHNGFKIDFKLDFLLQPGVFLGCDSKVFAKSSQQDLFVFAEVPVPPCLFEGRDIGLDSRGTGFSAAGRCCFLCLFLLSFLFFFLLARLFFLLFLLCFLSLLLLYLSTGLLNFSTRLLFLSPLFLLSPFQGNKLGLLLCLLQRLFTLLLFFQPVGFFCFSLRLGLGFFDCLFFDLAPCFLLFEAGVFCLLAFLFFFEMRFLLGLSGCFFLFQFPGLIFFPFLGLFFRLSGIFRALVYVFRGISRLPLLLKNLLLKLFEFSFLLF